MTKPTTAQTATDQATPAWRNAPWVMAVLAITLLAGQFFNNGNAVQPVLGWYQSSGLKTLEWDNYLSWLRFNNQSDLSQRLEQNAGMDAHVYSAALFTLLCIVECCHIFNKRTEKLYGSEADIWDLLMVIPQNPLYLFFLIYCFIIFVATLMLSIYHTVISTQNLTTNEHIKNYYRPGDNPFDCGRGIVDNRLY